MVNLGSNWNHKSRMRETLLRKSYQVPPLSLLIKDHKVMNEEGLPSTRPVVSACRGMNVPLSDLLSEILEPLARDLMNSNKVISSEHLLNMIDSLNKEWEGQQ